MQGTVTHFQWTNPHVYIELETMDPAGADKHWTIECANPGILNRVGWKFNMIKVGDKLTVIVAPLRTGEPGALLKQVTLPDGRCVRQRRAGRQGDHPVDQSEHRGRRT
ncbi:MAG: DUF6152 family protein [Caulobacteraceae bacterium]